MDRARHKAERTAIIVCFIALWLCVAVAACDQDFAWASKLGIRVATGEMQDYFTPEQVDAHADAVLVQLELHGWAEDELRRGLTVEVVSIHDKPLDEPCQHRNGCVLGNGVKVVAFPCVWNTALRHEMTHHLEAYVTGAYDYGHQAAYWATADDPLGSCP